MAENTLLTEVNESNKTPIITPHHFAQENHEYDKGSDTNVKDIGQIEGNENDNLKKIEENRNHLLSLKREDLVLIKGPAWIALMTIDDEYTSQTGEKSKSITTGFVGKFIFLKRVVLQAKIKRQKLEERKNIVNTSLKEMMQSTIFKGENIQNIDKNFSNNDTSIHTTSPATAALEAAKGFWDGSKQNGDTFMRMSKKKKRKHGSDDSTNAPDNNKESDNEFRTMGRYFEEELGLLLPDQNNGKKRARRRGPRSMTSGFRGVTCYRRTGRWEAHIWENRRQIHLGSFSNPSDAARSYDRAALRFRGIDADLNFDIKDYRDDPVLRSGSHLTNEEFVKLLRAHDKISNPSKTSENEKSDEKKNSNDPIDIRDPEYEKRLRCYIVKHVSTDHYQQKPGMQKAGSINEGVHQNGNMQRTIPKPKYTTDAFAMNQAHPNFHPSVQFQYANASAMDHNAVMFNHIQAHPNEAVTLPVPMMQVWNVGQMDEVNNSNIEFLAISGDVNDPNGFNGPRSSDINPEMVFNLVDPNGVPIQSQNNSPQSQSIRSDMIPHENGIEYAKGSGHGHPSSMLQMH